MADFIQTMKDWKRMCSAMKKLRPVDSCCGCPLEEYGCPAIYGDNSHVDYDDVEKKVTAWAADHPEPVYPTLGEWLHSLHWVKIDIDPMLLDRETYCLCEDCSKLLNSFLNEKRKG